MNTQTKEQPSAEELTVAACEVLASAKTHALAGFRDWQKATARAKFEWLTGVPFVPGPGGV